MNKIITLKLLPHKMIHFAHYPRDFTVDFMCFAHSPKNFAVGLCY